MLRLIATHEAADERLVTDPLPGDVKAWGAVVHRDPKARGGMHRAFLGTDTPTGRFLVTTLEPGQRIEWGGKDKRGRQASRRYWTIVDVSPTHLLVDESGDVDAHSAWTERLSEHGPRFCAEMLALRMGLGALLATPARVAGERQQNARLTPVCDYLLGLADSWLEADEPRDTVAELRAERAQLMARVAEIDAALAAKGCVA